MTGVDVAAIRDERGYFEGYTGRECGEHRTVGDHRAWCHDCSEWCYPIGGGGVIWESACRGCGAPALLAALAVAEQQRDDALAKIARVTALVWRVKSYITTGDGCQTHVSVAALDAALTDPRPPSATPTAETVPPRVAGTGGPQNPAQSRGGGE